MLSARRGQRRPSNGRSASSTSGLLAPAAESSAGRAACSCLSWPAVLPRRPHRPHTTPTAGQAIPPLTHSPCYSAATADEPVNPRTVVLPSAWETTVESSLPPCRPLPRPRRRPSPWCSRRGVVNDVHPTAVVLESCILTKLTKPFVPVNLVGPLYWVPANRGSIHFFVRNKEALPCVRRYSWWVRVVSGGNVFSRNTEALSVGP